MKQRQILSNEFTWKPSSYSGKSRFPGLAPSIPQETRTPVLWLARKGHDLYLINDTNEVLNEVFSETGGFQTVDDTAVNITSDNGYRYKNIEPAQAVKVDEYDDHYDLDYLIQVVLSITSNSLGKIEILSPLSKGGISRNTALLWDTGEPGKDVHISKVE